MKRIIAWIAAAYIAGCIILSALASCGACERFVIEHRAPFVIVQMTLSTVEGKTQDGHWYGANHLGGYTGFGYDPQEYSVGDKVLTALVWNPANNYEDDIALRFDLTL